MQQLFIGVDGGATKSIIRIENAAGELLGQELCGPASLRLSITQTWQTITLGIAKILQKAALNLEECELHVGMGLAGCELAEALAAFLQAAPHYATLSVSSDSHTACLAAHAGADGAIIIAGTGVVGYQIENGKRLQVGGWGFPHDDEGGGAWLGLQAIRLTLQWLDGRFPETQLGKSIFAYFGNNQERLVHWANQANSTAFATLAPIVIEESQHNEVTAIKLLELGAQALDAIAHALVQKQKTPIKPLPCALIGGITPFLEPYLHASVKERLYPPRMTPDQGAILLVKQHMQATLQIAT